MCKQTEVASKGRSVAPQQQQAPETPLNLSTKPKAKGIWSPASLCEEEQSRRTSIGKAASPDRCDSPSQPDSPGRRSSEAEESPYYHHATSAATNGAAFARGPTAAALFRPFDPFYNMRPIHGGGSWNKTKDDHHHHQEQHSPQDSRQSSNGEDSVYSDSVKDEDMTAHFCRTCDQSFSSAHALEAHVRQNHCDRDSVSGVGGDGRVSSGAFPCSRCPKVFELGASLEQHLATHHATRSFQVKETLIPMALSSHHLVIRLTLCLLCSVNSAERRSSGRRRSRRTSSSIRTLGRIRVSIAARDSTRNPT